MFTGHCFVLRTLANGTSVIFPFSFETDLLSSKPLVGPRGAASREPLALRRSRCDKRVIGRPPKTIFNLPGDRAEIGR